MVLMMTETPLRLGKERQRVQLIETCISWEFVIVLNEKVGFYLEETVRKVEAQHKY